MKKLFCASCLLAMMILFSGCGVPATPAQTNSTSSVADDTTQTASVPYSLGLPELSCGISEKLMEKAGDTLAAHPSLPVYQLEPVLLNENEAFQTLSGQKADDAMDVSSWSYPDNEGNAVLMRSGLEPFYDYWLDIQCFTNRGTDLFYETGGSTPVKSGAMMAIDKNNRSYGTIGGGCSENAVRLAAYRMIGTGQRRSVRIDLSNDVAEDAGMVCGGWMKVLIQDVRNTEPEKPTSES